MEQKMSKNPRRKHSPAFTADLCTVPVKIRRVGAFRRQSRVTGVGVTFGKDGIHRHKYAINYRLRAVNILVIQ